MTPLQKGGINMAETTAKTMSVPEAGAHYYGLSRNGSYDAAKRGDIPTIKVGRLRRVPVAAMERKLEQVEKSQAEEAV
jgi:hypothetical protein